MHVIINHVKSVKMVESFQSNPVNYSLTPIEYMSVEVKDDNSDEEEYKALTSTLLAFYNFHIWANEEFVKPRRTKLASLSQQELELVPWFPRYIEDLDLCVGLNKQFTQNLALAVAQDWGVSHSPNEWYQCSYGDYDKVRSVMLQLTREWSSDGEKERDISFGRVINELCKRYPDHCQRQHCKVLVPGCGLGRLVLEFVKQGFWCQGNEYSYHMLLASNFMLNHCQFAHEHSLLPYIHKFSHSAKRLNQLRPVTVPDYCPLAIQELQNENPLVPYGELMSMTAGSFVDLYGPANLSCSTSYSNDLSALSFRESNKDTYDALVTCFFLDTASNIIDYLKTIHHCLKPGGIWINFGPLLWHFEDDDTVHTIHKQLNPKEPEKKVPCPLKGLELSRDDLIDLVTKIGFKFEVHQSGIETPYSTDPKALAQFVYKCEYWVCKKL